ncbi:MAG: OmpA family protein, partial [Bacteroidota bacterium]
DTDKDGVNDKEDKCPTEAGTLSTNGCPDADKDGVSDGDDHCPLEKGIAANNGCPEKISVDGIADRFLHFKPGSAVVDRFEVIDILEPVSDKLFFDDELKLVITGHAFDEGNTEQSKALSKARAEAVKQYFVDHNVPAEKIETVFYGDMKPFTESTTDDGKKQNRRSEIYIIRK